MVGALAQDVGLGDASLLVEPIVGVLRELADRVGGEEPAVQQVAGRLVGDRLDAVLTELRGVAVTGGRVGPAASLTVEPVDLVQPPQAPPGPDEPHRLDGPGQRDADGLDSRRRSLGPLDLDVRLVDLVLSRDPAHATPVPGHSEMTRPRGDLTGR